MTYPFKLVSVSSLPFSRLLLFDWPIRAQRTWRAFYAMTSSLVWDDVKFKMDGITTSAQKSIQHWIKSRLCGGKTVLTTAGVSIDRLLKLPLNKNEQGGWKIVGGVLLRRSFFLFLPDVTGKGGCAAVKPEQILPVLQSATPPCQAGVNRFFRGGGGKKTLPQGMVGVIHSPHTHTPTASVSVRTACVFIPGLPRRTP